jgi:hypothetical protein
MKRLLLLLFAAFAMGAYSPPGGLINTYTLQGCGCGEDDTAEITAAIANPATTIIVPVGVWTVSSTVNITASNSSGNTIVGVDRYGSIIRAKSGSNLDYIFSYNTNGSLAPFTVDNITLDANASGQSSGKNDIMGFTGTGATADTTFRNSVFENCGTGGGCFVFAATSVATRISFLNDTFINSACRDIYATNATDFLILGNSFNNYNTQATADCPAIGTYTHETPLQPINNWDIVGNVFAPLVSQQPGIEFIPDTITPASGISIVANSCNANTVGGCGISGALDNSSIVNNTFINGTFGYQSGLHVAGNALTVTGNSFQNAAINIGNNLTAYPAGPHGIVVAQNTFQSTGVGTGISEIFVNGLINDYDITGNDIITNWSATTGLAAAIYIGAGSASTTLANGRIEGNRYTDISTGQAGICMQLLATASSYTTFKDNFCSATSGYGIKLHGAVSVDTYLTIQGNDFRKVATPVSGVPTGTGYFLGTNWTSASQIIQPGGAPSIASGFGSSPSISAGVNPNAFSVNVGTGGSTSTGVVTMPAALNGWNCKVTPQGAPQAAAVTYSAPTSATSITLTNYTLTSGAALNWTSATVLDLQCQAY